MNLLRSPKHKLVVATVLLAALVVVAQRQGLETVSAARVLLGAGALIGLGLWLKRTRAAQGAAAPPPRLQVLSRTGLSQRCSLALVEADGRTFLVAYGDGFAQVHDAPVQAPAVGRRVLPAAKSFRKAGGR